MTRAESQRLAQVEQEILARRPEHSIDPTLDRISALVTLLGDPQRAYPVIHITGTNGKTSTARMTERLLRARGLRTGLFTSPHLTSFRERIRVDGVPVTPERFIEVYEELTPYLELVDARQPARLSFFEVLCGMAFAVFADAPVDVAILEVGLGGTWDSTNVADGAVAVVTPIALDHTRWLGATVEEIATEKSGIIKPGAIAVLAQQAPSVAEILLRRAAEAGATVAREGLEFGVLDRELAVGGQQLSIRGLLGDYEGLFLPLFGAHQAGNLACALAAVEAFARAEPVGTPALDTAELNGHDPDEDDAGEDTATTADLDPGRDMETGRLDIGLVRDAVADMSSPGRLEIVRRSPVVIVDAAHNPAGMAATVAALEEAFTFTELIAVVAISEDKDVTGVLDELEPVTARLVVTRNSTDRSMDPAGLADLAEPVFGPDRISVAKRLDDAIELAVTLADEADAGQGGAGAGRGGAVVLITGSVITAGEARLLLTQAGPDDGPAGELS
ncbi:MAG TPA: folylpolyglutamate synthase/dihydrofolate synthase family protein [Streptosporangiaceae bacterium]